MHWLKSELRGLIEYFALPGLAAVLPWPWCYRLFRRAAAWRFLYRSEWRAALAVAGQHVTIADPEDWARRYRLLRLVDHADLWLSLFRSDRWLRRHLDQDGAWPAPGKPFVGIFFHWGPGLWPVRALKAAGHPSAVLAGHFSRRSMGGAWLGYRYGAARLRELARASGRPLIFSPGTVRQSLAVLAQGDCVIGTPDVPPTETRAVAPVRLFDRPAWYAEGLLRIARQAGAPVVVFCFPLDLATGNRGLRILGEFDPDQPDLLQQIVGRWQCLLTEASWAFSLWPMMASFFTPPAGRDRADGLDAGPR